MTGSGQDEVTKGHTIFVSKCGHAIHVFEPFCMQNSAMVFRESYLKYSGLNLHIRGQSRSSEVNFLSSYFFVHTHDFGPVLSQEHCKSNVKRVRGHPGSKSH